ncbi:hypothetical protein DACRYDRAFT_74294 [Dacryopinax primogenitus]|uniref:CENP-C homolog n=1 Tax=Dacryopinax primogenitus (strain DJM 731) TaxID=1858805 RepID=M5GGA7_DACPD|nr:uncharacterized protein DACRYDRAFT_74294 [Dacryopinax primogenitus]EJU05158.1 hypothetical protein DACRYDRAFT_74294 [Dacryopinax primogenitus]
MEIDTSIIGATTAFFEGRPSVVSNRSRLSQTEADYEGIPSPSVSRVGRPRSSQAPLDPRTPRRRPRDSDNEDELTRPPDSASVTRITPHTPGSPSKSRNVVDGPGEVEDVPETSPTVAGPRRKGKGRPSGESAGEAEPAYDDDQIPQYDGMDLAAEEPPPVETNGHAEAEETDEHKDVQEEEEEEGQEEEEAQEEEEEQDEEEDEDEDDESPPPKRGRGRPRKGEVVKRKPEKAATTSKGKRGRPRKEDSQRAPSRRPRSQTVESSPERGISEVIDVHGGDGEGHFFDSEGRRRNARVRYAPLEYWRNEKVVYGRRQSGVAVVPVIKQIIKVAPDPVRPVGTAHRTHPWKKRKASTDNEEDEEENEDEDEDNEREHKRARSEQRGYVEEDPPEKGWDSKTDPLGVVMEYVTKTEVERRVAFTQSMVQPREAANARFKFQKIFGDGEFLAAGMLSIPVGETKPAKSSKDNSYVFYVIQGAVKVQIYRTSFLVSIGGMFLVPRGNVYEIENVAERETVLFFAQARKIPEDGNVSMQDSQGTPIKRRASMTPGPDASRVSMTPRRSEPPRSIERSGSRSGSRAASSRPNGYRRRH